MKTARLALLATSMLSVMLLAGPSFAAERGEGKAPDAAEASRAMGTVSGKAAKAKPNEVKVGDRSAKRDLNLDPEAAAKAYTLVGRTSDGKDVTIAPDAAVLDAIKAEKSGDKRTSVEGGGGDPADSASRDIIGQDNRLQITNSTSYPYTTIGYLQMENKKGEVWSCTATVIGPKTAITAANCLYNHDEEGGWRQKMVFWPALNGEDNAPYGGWDVDTAYVFQAYITDFDGSYDTIWQYDLGLITFKDPIGDSVGWLGYTGEDMADFQGTVVGYQDDKPSFTMWRSACNILTENITAVDIIHDCDTTWSTDGAPLYFYDAAAKGRYIAGINIGPAGDANWALKITPAMAEWIASINK